MRRLIRAIAVLFLLGVPIVALATPAQAAEPPCPKHPANMAGKHVHASLGDDEALACADLRGATLDGLNLDQFDLHDANLTKASLRGTQLAQVDLTGAKLAGARFDGANLEQATLTNVTAAGASFVKANLEQATIKSATLRDADLTGADLLQADLTGSDLRGAKLTGTNFDQATLKNVKKDPQAKLATSAGGGGVVGSISGGTDLVWRIAPYIIAGCVLLVILMVVGAVRRGARRALYVFPTSTGGPTVWQPPVPPPGSPVAAQFGPTAGPPASPTQTVPIPTQPAADQPYAPTTSFAGSDWQPPTVAATNYDAQHVIEEPEEKRWFH